MVSLEIRQWTFILPVGVVLLINLFIFSSLVRVIANAANPDKSATENALVSDNIILSHSITLSDRVICISDIRHCYIFCPMICLFL